jgi:arginyl-tRNA synthetase
MLVLGAEKKKDIQFKDLLKTYIGINKKVENNPKLEKEVFNLLHKLEAHDDETVKRFREIVDICIKGQSEIFSKLNIEYDVFDYESDYLWKQETKTVLEKLKETGKLFTDEHGRLVLNQEGYNLAMKSPVLVLTRADKTSLYPLRDIAYTLDKINKGFERNILVLGEDQKLYFQQLSSALDLLGHKSQEVIHYSFVLLTEGKMSTRKGTVVLLEDFMKEAVDKAKKELKKREIGGEELENRAGAIAYSAIKYSILKVSPEKNVTFDWEHALAFEGDTGPYLQYAYARICSILSKHGEELDKNIDFTLLKKTEETNLIKKLEEFPSIVKSAEEELRPHLIATYIYSLSRLLSEFYHKCNVLKEKDKLKKARLVLIDSVRQVLKNGLNLLGIDVLERM